MANVHRVYIEGRLPFDIVQRGGDIVENWFAMFSSPCWGLRIKYGKQSKEPNSHGGVNTYYDFVISGEEAVWGKHIEEFCRELKKAGAEIRKANIVDIDGGECIDPGESHSIMNRL